MADRISSALKYRLDIGLASDSKFFNAFISIFREASLVASDSVVPMAESVPDVPEEEPSG